MMTAARHGEPSRPPPRCRWQHVARGDRMMLWSPAASSGRHRARVLTGVKAPRCAPPPLRGAHGLTPLRARSSGSALADEALS